MSKDAMTDAADQDRFVEFHRSHAESINWIINIALGKIAKLEKRADELERIVECLDATLAKQCEITAALEARLRLLTAI